MRSPRIASLAVLLALAGAAALLWPGSGMAPPPETAASAPMKRTPRGPAGAEAIGGGRPSSPAADPLLTPDSGFPHPRPRQADPPRAGMAAGGAAPPEEAVPPVERRLHELTVALGLTDTQRQQVRFLLARSSPRFDPSLIPIAPGDFATPLSPAEADGEIHALLDPVQQGEFEDLLLDRDQWWAEVIGRLERDLHQSTDPARSLVPEEVPPAEVPPAEPAAPELPPRPAPRHGDNLFDLLREP